MKNTILLLCGVFTLTWASAQRVYTLDECKEMALENNVKAKNARLVIDQAKEQEREAFSKYFPSVSASGNYFHSYDDLVQEKISMNGNQQQQLAGIITQLGLNPSVLAGLPSSYTMKAIDHGTIANLMAVEPIYAGRQIANANKLAKVQSEIRTLQLQQSNDEIINSTESYYNQLVSLYAKQRTLDAVDKQLAQIHKDAQNAYQAGVSNRNDVLSVELKQNEVATNRLKLDNGIQLCKMVLARYIGRAGETVEIDTRLPEQLPDPSYYYTDPEAALDNRAESQLLDKSVKASELQTKIKRGTLMPTVSVGVAGIYQDLSNAGNLNGIGLATVSLPIGQWWSGNHAVRYQKIAENIARQDSDNNRQLLLIQIQSTYNDLNNAYKQIELAKKSIEKSTENLRLNEDYYHAGTAAMSDLLDAQTQDQQAHDQYTDAVAQYLNCRTAYLIATGRNAVGSEAK